MQNSFSPKHLTESSEMKQVRELYSSKSIPELIKEVMHLFSSKQINLKVRKLKDGSRAYLFNKLDIKDMTQDQLANIVINAAFKKHNLIRDEESEQQSHHMQQELDLANGEISTLTKKIKLLEKTKSEEERSHKDEVNKLNKEIEKLKNASNHPNVFADVLAFTEIDMAHKVPLAPKKKFPAATVKQLKGYIDKEFEELQDCRDAHSVADWFVDHVYYIINTATRAGYRLSEVWRLVQEANMRKFPNGVATHDKNGKVLKPKGWVSNDDKIKKIVNNAIKNQKW